MVAVAFGARDHGGRVTTRARLGNRDGSLHFPSGIGLQVFLALLLGGDCQQHVHVGRIRRKHEWDNGAAELFVDAHPGFGIEVCAAELFGRIQGPEAEFSALFQQWCFFLRGELEGLALGLARKDSGFQRHEFMVDEFRDQINDHPGFIHGVVRLVLCCHYVLHSGRAVSGTLFVVFANNNDHTVRRNCGADLRPRLSELLSCRLRQSMMGAK